ncbi:Alpha/Beta hydrolase protein [Aspergillus carlsbadensis]|nr:Alpha/Beta hydrolase protein [Aspergillus carlsbadensis]
MPTLSTLRSRAQRLLLILLAKTLRPIIVTLARLSGTPKATPDSIEYVPVNTNSTTDHTIKLHIYTPRSSTSDEGCRTLFPVLITCCGSGFVMPGHGLDTDYCRYIADTTKHTVLDVGYRLAPEHPFPAALKDVAAIVSHVLSQPAKYDASRISIGGFSAGANLATSVAVNYFPPGTFKNLVTFYPVLDASIPAATKITSVPEALRKPKYGGMATVPVLAMRIFQACYVSCCEADLDERGVCDPRVSPVYAALDRFPGRCLFVTAECDGLAAEAEGLAGRVAGCGHAFDKRVKAGSEREKVKMEVYEAVARFLNGGEVPGVEPGARSDLDAARVVGSV